ncbi:hypothetical protein [Saccharopolyspora hordei]|uniref:DUF3558 domain-containing protein n=1 Tax=Saccharopolyspora hordei TaxID=1838 RepID=A0A853ADS3_9PSEU|nr:hypothetical protein [Saccharopolyspora hordei]NYI81956.1 hypothetical protein [Saccharopolyspora hordei]
MSGATRVRRSLGVGLSVLVIGIGLTAASWILPPPSEAPSYTSVPNACESVSPLVLDRAFAPRRAELDAQHHGAHDLHRSSTCQWRAEGPVQDVRKSGLDVEVATEFDLESRPDTAYVDQFLDYLALEPGATEVPGLGSRAVLIRSPLGVELVAAEANLTVSVRYNAAKPTKALVPVARAVAEELLTAAGTPR